MARRKQADNRERQTVSLSLWITPSEKAELDERAKAAGVKLADLARAALFGFQLKAKDPLREKALFELNAIGNNINQIAKHANITDEIDQQELKNVLHILQDVAGRLYE